METKLQSKQQYPRFIQNKPCGIDKFDGGSQERLAKTIMPVILWAEACVI